MRFVANGNSSALGRRVSTLAGMIILCAICVGSTSGQDITLRIKIDKRGQAEITGQFAEAFSGKVGRQFEWLDEFAGTSSLSKRFTGLMLTTRPSDAVISQFTYNVDLKPLFARAAAAHVSWIGENGGLLMLDDLIPQVKAMTGQITIDVPAGWEITTTETPKEPNVYQVGNVEKAVFILGNGRREKMLASGKSAIRLSISDNWHFTDDEAGAISSEIFARYREIFGEAPAETFLIAISKFPTRVDPGNWEADTRGATSVIISSDMPFASQSQRRLHEQLRHEIFHFWMPNGVNLSGNYDWFYEGFALYESAKMGVMTNTISFDNFLDVLSRAHAIDSRQESRLSLIEASQRRFAGENTRVYARGMVTAFLCDLAMLEKSRGKRSSADILRSVYQRYRNSQPRTDGNDAVLATMAEWPELVPILERFIRGDAVIDWQTYIAYAGLESTNKTTGRGLAVSEKPKGRQKDLLDRLGYNMWRKAAARTK